MKKSIVIKLRAVWRHLKLREREREREQWWVVEGGKCEN